MLRAKERDDILLKWRRIRGDIVAFKSVTPVTADVLHGDRSRRTRSGSCQQRAATVVPRAGAGGWMAVRLRQCTVQQPPGSHISP